MNKEMFGYVYMITNLKNNKRYIGKHKTNKEKNSYLGSGFLLKKAMDKYGKENFKKEIICKCYTLEELNECEKHFINRYDACKREDFYNISSGGTGGRTWQNYSDEDREKSLEKYRGKNSPLYGIPRTKEVIEKVRKGNIGKKRSEETRKRMSERQLGEKNYWFGKKRPEHSKIMSGEKHPMAKKIFVYDENMKLVNKFNCKKDCLEFYKIPPTTFGRCLNNKIHNKTKLYFKTEEI